MVNELFTFLIYEFVFCRYLYYICKKNIMIKSEINLDDAIKLYKTNGSLHETARILHTSHIRLSTLFKQHYIKIANIGKRRDISDGDIELIKKLYLEGVTISDISEKLKITVKKVRKILKESNIKTGRWHNYTKPSKTINSINKSEKGNKPLKKCPYCNWYTYDVDNYSHAYSKHIIQEHESDINKHLSFYPEDLVFFEKILKRREGKIQCQICGKYLSLIDERHLKKHGITKQQYIEMYGQDLLISKSCKNKLHNCIEKMYENPDWNRFTSTYESKLQDFLTGLNVPFEAHNRTLLKPQELDIFIPHKDCAIEFNGNKFHTEWVGGKSRQYHLNKTKLCKQKGIKLIHIFEDEFHNSKEIVLNKIAHILGLQQSLPKIMARKCIIKKIDNNIAELFLNKYHIQGYVASTVHYGAIYNDELIAVMSFKMERKNSNNWELTRFASDYSYICCGVGGKLFKHFIREYNPNSVKSFADRRWTVNEENNIYIQLGFKFDGYTPPDYKYYNPTIDRYRRFHKFGFRKKILLKKYPDILVSEMTETEMVKVLGYDRIWDCGLIKYVWRKE